MMSSYSVDDDLKRELATTTVSLNEFIKRSNELPLKSSTQQPECSFGEGRRRMFACPTCQCWVCVSCSECCHLECKVVDLGYRRIPCSCSDNSCKLISKSSDKNNTLLHKFTNTIHNMEGRFCYCDKNNDEDDVVEGSEEMFQCLLCEDWYHDVCLKGTVEVVDDANDDEGDEMICCFCIEKYPFLGEVGKIECLSQMNRNELITPKEIYLEKNWRSSVSCKCNNCALLWTDISFILSEEALLEEDEDSDQEDSLRGIDMNKTLAALDPLDREKLDVGINAMGQFKEKFIKFVQPFQDSGALVTKTDIDMFITSLAGNATENAGKLENLIESLKRKTRLVKETKNTNTPYKAYIQESASNVLNFGSTKINDLRVKMKSHVMKEKEGTNADKAVSQNRDIFESTGNLIGCIKKGTGTVIRGLGDISSGLQRAIAKGAERDTVNVSAEIQKEKDKQETELWGTILDSIKSQKGISHALSLQCTSQVGIVLGITLKMTFEEIENYTDRSLTSMDILFLNYHQMGIFMSDNIYKYSEMGLSSCLAYFDIYPQSISPLSYLAAEDTMLHSFFSGMDESKVLYYLGRYVLKDIIGPKACTFMIEKFASKGHLKALSSIKAIANDPLKRFAYKTTLHIAKLLINEKFKASLSECYIEQWKDSLPHTFIIEYLEMLSKFNSERAIVHYLVVLFKNQYAKHRSLKGVRNLKLPESYPRYLKSMWELREFFWLCDTFYDENLQIVYDLENEKDDEFIRKIRKVNITSLALDYWSIDVIISKSSLFKSVMENKSKGSSQIQKRHLRELLKCINLYKPNQLLKAVRQGANALFSLYLQIDEFKQIGETALSKILLSNLTPSIFTTILATHPKIFISPSSKISITNKMYLDEYLVVESQKIKKTIANLLPQARQINQMVQMTMDGKSDSVCARFGDSIRTITLEFDEYLKGFSRVESVMEVAYAFIEIAFGIPKSLQTSLELEGKIEKAHWYIETSLVLYCHKKGSFDHHQNLNDTEGDADSSGGISKFHVRNNPPPPLPHWMRI